MTATDNITLGELARQIADGEVDIIQPLERPRADLEHRREIAKSYTRDKALTALMQMAADCLIKPRAAGEPTLILADESSVLTSKDVEKAILALRRAVDWDAHLLMEERAREKGMRHHGRYTIKGAAKELSANTGIAVKRWLTTLMGEIRRGDLPLRNPRDFGDQLPYPVPSEMDFVLELEHVAIEDLNAMLEQNRAWKIAYRFGGGSTASQIVSDKRIPIRVQQDNAVLDKIRQLGIDPLAFPKNEPGMPGLKAEVRDAILKSPSHLFSSRTTFNATWDRLRATDKIVDAPTAEGIPKN